MCGIAGIINRTKSVNAGDLETMLDSLMHRGPDGVGRYVNRNVAIGMRRLSIIDLEGGNQPIFNEKKDKLIVFNGELYNYKELRSELIGTGHKFITNSDTEVVLHHYEEYGVDGLKKLNGMWAIAILDIKKNTLLLARDHFGIKPLAYYLDKNLFMFGSEIKALLAPKMINKEIRNQAISEYLTFRYVPGPETMWKGIVKLPPGHWLRLDVRNWKTESGIYWEMIYPEAAAMKRSQEDWLREWSTLFEDAIERQLQADVPVGILLSGGLDSSVVASAVKKINPEKTLSFSVGFAGEPEYNELEYSRLAAKHLKIKNYEVEITYQNFVDYLPKLVYQTDEPLADLAAIPLSYVAKLARSQVKVVLSGEGSDELLAGYNFEKVAEQLKKELPWNVRAWPKKHLPYISKVFSDGDKNKLLKDPERLGDAMEILRGYYAKFPKAHPLNQILYAYSLGWLVEDLLAKADRMTMANSLELRVPFLDYRLAELSAGLPVDLKVGMWNDRLVTKKILRMYANKTGLPDAIISRGKKGFPVPAYDWLSTKLKLFAKSVVNNKSLITKYLNWPEVKNILDKAISENGESKYKHELWQLIILELWLTTWKK